MSLLHDPPNHLAVEFVALSEDDPNLAPYLTADNSIDYQDPEACIQLAKTTLSVCFNVKFDVPRDRLCPPIPIRYEYIMFLRELLDSTVQNLEGVVDSSRAVHGFDVGTGASCIYPLLGTAIGPNWTFTCTEIDEASYKSAVTNVKLNKLDDRIHVFKSYSARPLLCLDRLNVEYADFTMCNPPFYSATREMVDGSATKQDEPSAVCTGSETEMVVAGGEVQFIKDMVDESLLLKDRVQWFSSMLGVWGSVRQVVDHLKEVGVDNWALKALSPGARTKRWVVAWSFQHYRPPAQLSQDGPDHVTPYTDVVLQSIPATQGDVGERLNTILRGFDLSWSWDGAVGVGRAVVRKNVWSRHYRRAKDRGDFDFVLGTEEHLPVQLVVVVFAREGEVTLRWTFVADAGLKLSFLGMVYRHLKR